MKPVRVLRIYHSAVVGEYRARERLLRRDWGYDVQVACPRRWSEGGREVVAEPDDDVPTHVIGVRGRPHPILFWYRTADLRRLLRRFRPDIVDLHEEPYSLAVAAALRAVGSEVPGARICMYSAQNILKRYPQPFRHLEKHALAAASACYPCSTEAAHVLRAKGFAGSMHVLPLGVTPSGKARPRESAPIRLGFVARLEPYKGGEIAIRAFAAARTEMNITLEVVGAGSELPMLKAVAEALGVADHVSFPGAVSQAEALRRVSNYDLLLAPSLTTSTWKEQFGRVPAQALAAGTPVLAFASGSLSELLGGCGELAQEGNAEDFTNKLKALLQDPVRRALLSRLGRERAANVLSWPKVAEGFDRMYRHAMAGRTAHFSYIERDGVA